MSAADPISYKGIEISTIEGRFVLFLTDFTKKCISPDTYWL